MAVPRRILVPIGLSVAAFLVAAGLLGYLFSLPADRDSGQLASFYRTITNTCTQDCTERVGDARRCARTCECITDGIRERVPQAELTDAIARGDNASARRLIDREMPAINRECRNTGQ